MKTNSFIILCSCALLLNSSMGIVPSINGKQCISTHTKNISIHVYFFLLLFLIKSFYLFVVGETHESKIKISVDGYIGWPGGHAIWQSPSGSSNRGGGGIIINFPDGGKFGGGGNIIIFLGSGKRGGRANVIIFPGGGNGGGGGKINEGHKSSIGKAIIKT